MSEPNHGFKSEHVRQTHASGMRQVHGAAVVGGVGGVVMSRW